MPDNPERLFLIKWFAFILVYGDDDIIPKNARLEFHMTPFCGDLFKPHIQQDSLQISVRDTFRSTVKLLQEFLYLTHVATY